MASAAVVAVVVVVANLAR